MSSSRIDLVAPLNGLVVPIETVPDPVFAQKMVGDGVSIDPMNAKVLMAPVSGKVTQLHSAGHAITLSTAHGIEVLIHIGLDTVMLKGEGFKPLVKVGDTVRTGQSLIEFDPKVIEKHGKSLLTQIVLTNADKVSAILPATGFVRAGLSTLMTLEIESAPAASAAAAAASGAVLSDIVKIPNPTGLHARPAAVVANTAKSFSSDIKLVRGGEEANAKSVVAIMGLEIQFGDEIRVKATGADAATASKKVAELITSGSGEAVGGVPAAKPATVTTKPAVAKPVSTDPNTLSGVAASPGLAVGQIFQLKAQTIHVTEQGQDQSVERRRLNDALKEASHQLEAIKAEVQDASKAEIFSAHQELLADPELLDLAVAGITNGKSAGFAWREAYNSYAETLAKLKNEVLAGRANDIRDVGQRVLRLLAGVKEAELVVPNNAILIAEELTPSDTAQLDRNKVLGFATTGGGATSHVAILARSMNLPAVCGIDDAVLALANGETVVLDGSKGTLRKNPTAAEVNAIREQQAVLAKKREAELASAMRPAVTVDGHKVEVVANIGGLDDAVEGVKLGGEGVGLLRSEFLYLERTTAPTEDEQAQIYTDIAKAVGKDKPLVIRTLDVGGDKPLPYLPMPVEENPFLGVRGVRLCLAAPDIMRAQVRAILRAAPYTKMHVMFPMIASLEEVRDVKAIIAEEKAALKVTADIKIGIMVEVPSTAIMSELFAREVDFFSIGTNDLTQYTLAMDRGHPKLAKVADALHPGVLRLIAETVKGAHKHGKWVGVCGGIASDPLAVPALIGLGVDELSVSVPAIPAIKALVRTLDRKRCIALADEILQLGTTGEIRAKLATVTAQ
ncbi:phosphoenolpyruvate--protein phosphotransferase [Chitinibacteraceae bacterium HSL-7]